MILNITADYPDAYADNKTSAVKNLIAGSGNRHFIVSINRTSNPFSINCIEDSNSISIKYFGLPYGVFMLLSLMFLSYKLKRIIIGKKLKFMMVYAHKLSVEGVVAYHLSRLLSIPYYCSLWGGSDRKIIRTKIFSRWFYRRIYSRASGILPASPWIHRYIEDLLMVKNYNVVNLPVVTENTISIKSRSVSNKFVTIFNLDLFELKGLPNLLLALSHLDVDNWTLDVYGNGSIGAISKINTLIKEADLEGKVILKGYIKNSDVTNELSQYSCFLMPTKNETFGMVYVEALFSGIPILYSKNQGVDGYFDDVYVGVKVDPFSTQSILSGIKILINEQDKFKMEISKLHEIRFFDFLKKKQIVDVFDSLLNSSARY